MLVAAERKAETALAKFHARFRELAKWRMRESRAKSALRDMFVRAKDNKLARARPTLVQQGGKRRAIAQQVTVESGALQKRRSGVGGTEYTTCDRLLAWQEDAVAGLSSRHDRSDKSNADRTRRQDSVSFVMHPLGTVS